jgi:5-methylcytosine-specific restriction endonuclease McrA
VTRSRAEEVKRLAEWHPPCQLNLFAWADAYYQQLGKPSTSDIRREMGRAIRKGIIPTWSTDEAHREARWAADHAALYDGLPKWHVLRKLIYERDRGVCWVCGRAIARDEYNLGHLIDRACGGLDIPQNLAVMHVRCNYLKPLTNTREEAIAWRGTLTDSLI